MPHNDGNYNFSRLLLILGLDIETSKRIVLFVRSLRGRGVERSYLDLALCLQEAGMDVHLILRENVITLDASEVKNLYILEKETPAQKAVMLFSLLEKLEEVQKIDLIVSSNVSFLQKSGYKHPNIYYTVNMSWGYRLIRRLRFKKYFQVRREYQGQKIIAVSEGVKRDLLHYLFVRPEAIHVIYDPYDIEKIRMLAEENIPTNIPAEYIVHIGAFDKIKRHDILVKAFSQLSEDVNLCLVGEGKERSKIEKLVRKLGLEKRVHFLGWQKNPYPYLKKAKLTVLSSESEALPRVLIESLIVGTGVVSTDCKFGPSEIIKEELAIYLAKVNNPEDLAQKILYALRNPMKIKPTHYERFSKEFILKKYLNLIDIH